jgi:hypothetical protein
VPKSKRSASRRKVLAKRVDHLIAVRGERRILVGLPQIVGNGPVMKRKPK